MIHMPVCGMFVSMFVLFCVFLCHTTYEKRNERPFLSVHRKTEVGQPNHRGAKQPLIARNVRAAATAE